MRERDGLRFLFQEIQPDSEIIRRKFGLMILEMMMTLEMIMMIMIIVMTGVRDRMV